MHYNSIGIDYLLHSFSDIDECTEGTDGCNHHCTNTVGSYLCYCDVGFELHDNQKSCEGKIYQYT